MKFNVEKMRSIARPSSNEEVLKREYRRENAEWLNASAKIALNIRVALRKDDALGMEIISVPTVELEFA